MPAKMIFLARQLRKKSTDAERRIWRYLRAKHFDGLKFRRQVPIGNYIVDFVCFEKKLIIEIDGGQHAGEHEKSEDTERSRWLEGRGYKVLRFWNNYILSNMEGVWEEIARHL